MNYYSFATEPVFVLPQCLLRKMCNKTLSLNQELAYFISCVGIILFDENCPLILLLPYTNKNTP